MSHQQNAGQEHKGMTANQDVENVAKIEYQRMTLTNQNCKYIYILKVGECLLPFSLVYFVFWYSIYKHNTASDFVSI